MTKLMGDKLFELYAKLWNKYGSKKFSFEEAKTALNEQNSNKLIVMLHRLNAESVLFSQRTKEDTRIRQYSLKAPSRWIHEKLIEVQ